jgi:SAM-dependent methyltransferase
LFNGWKLAISERALRKGLMDDIDRLLAEQARYYRERAGEYDDWWFRRGRYDHGAQANTRWFADAALAEAALDRFKPAGEALELACGTGLWTRRLALHAERLTALDSAPEVLELARARVPEDHVRFEQADLFAWEPEPVYDVCFFSFWLSHIPEDRFDAFWEKARRALAPGGRVFFIDSLRSDLASAVDHALPARSEETMLRRLANGHEFRIVKRFHDPESLERRLGELGWSARVDATPEFFLHGQATPGR